MFTFEQMKFSTPEQPKQEVGREELFEQHAERIEKQGLQLQDQRYGIREITKKEGDNEVRALNPDYLVFHNSWHVREVVDVAERIARTLQNSDVPITERDISLARVISAFHDVVQDWQPQEHQGVVKRQRFSGDNERASADELVKYMKGANKEAGVDVFSKHDIKDVRTAIMATIPEFDPEHKTVVQPNLTEKSKPLTRVVALADLAAAGMAGGGRFIEEGKRLFREENLDFASASLGEIPDEKKEAIMQRMYAWMEFQLKFAAGRRDLFDTEIASLPKKAQTELHKLFNQFDDSTEAAQKIVSTLFGVIEDKQITVAKRFESAISLLGYEIVERQGKQLIYP